MYQLKKKIFVDAPITDVWEFFSSPSNLKKITPTSMGFDILKGADTSMYPGQIISYKVKPMLNIPTLWVTEITHVVDQQYFVDEQRIGPYRMWHHEHHFEQVDGGVEITDIVSYVLPFGFLGRIAHWLFVKQKLEHIFAFRSIAIAKYFKVTDR